MSRGLYYSIASPSLNMSNLSLAMGVFRKWIIDWSFMQEVFHVMRRFM